MYKHKDSGVVSDCSHPRVVKLGIQSSWAGCRVVIESNIEHQMHTCEHSHDTELILVL